MSVIQLLQNLQQLPQMEKHFLESIGELDNIGNSGKD